MKPPILLIIILYSIHSACVNDHPVTKKEIKTIKVDIENCKNSIDLKLSDLIDSCRLVQLETTNESMIDNRINLLNISKDYILIGDKNGVYKFSGDGKFIKKLINVGRGPDEISSYCIAYYYEAKKLLLIDNRLSSNDNIMCYDIQTESFTAPIKKCFRVNLSDFIVYEDSLIIGSIEIAGYMPQGPDSNPYALFIQDFNGNFISGIKTTKRLMHEDREGPFQRMSIHEGDKFIHVKYSHEDTIYNIIEKRLSPYFIPEFENNAKIPKLLPDIGTKHIGWDKYENRSFLIFNLSEFIGWKDENGFNRAAYNYIFYILNKSNGKYARVRSYNDDLLSKMSEIGKATNRIPGIPNSLPDGTMYVQYFPHDLLNSKNQESGVFPKSLFVELDSIRIHAKETDNPVFLIGMPKSILHILE